MSKLFGNAIKLQCQLSASVEAKSEYSFFLHLRCYCISQVSHQNRCYSSSISLFILREKIVHYVLRAADDGFCSIHLPIHLLLRDVVSGDGRAPVINNTRPDMFVSGTLVSHAHIFLT